MWRRKQQRRSAAYEDVRRVAEVLSRFNARLIEKHFALSAATAQEFMARLVEERLFGGLQPDGWHYPRVRKLRKRRPHRKPKIAKTVDFDQSIVAQPESAEDPTRRIDELEREGYALRARVKRLQDAGRAVITQREEWKTRALAAEEKMETERNRWTREYHRFDALRRLIAKELHPDFCTAGDIEKLIRAEWFKQLWPQIQQLAENRPASSDASHQGSQK
jgi:hypothetical protein